MWVKDSTLFIEGLAYIQGYDAPEFSYLKKHLCILNTQTNAIFEYELGSIRRHELKNRSYQGLMTTRPQVQQPKGLKASLFLN